MRSRNQAECLELWGKPGPQSTIMIYNTSYLAVLGPKCVQKGYELIRNLGVAYHSKTPSVSLVWCVCMCVCSVAQLYPTLWDPMDCSPLGSSVCGVSQARIMSPSRDRIHIPCITCIGRWILYHWATWEALSLSATSAQRH